MLNTVASQFLLAFVAIFVALDIIGAVPMYVRVTEGLTEVERRKITNVSMLVAFGVAIAFLFLGEIIFGHLGITLGDFRIAGGFILLLVALADLIGHSEVETRASGESGIVPLAVPLITGPGVLTTIVLQSTHFGYWIAISAMVVNYGIAWLFLKYSPGVNRVMGKDGTVIISKIAALLLSAYAVSMIRGGVYEAIEGFGHR